METHEANTLTAKLFPILAVFMIGDRHEVDPWLRPEYDL